MNNLQVYFITNIYILKSSISPANRPFAPAIVSGVHISYDCFAFCGSHKKIDMFYPENCFEIRYVLSRKLFLKRLSRETPLARPPIDMTTAMETSPTKLPSPSASGPPPRAPLSDRNPDRDSSSDTVSLSDDSEYMYMSICVCVCIINWHDVVDIIFFCVSS